MDEFNIQAKLYQAKVLAYKVALEDPWYFIKTFVYTLDVHDSQNPIKRFPDKRYLERIVDYWVKHRVLHIAKSRQMLISWLFAALYLWDSLHVGKLTFFQSKKEDDADSLLSRAKFIYYHLPVMLQWGDVDYKYLLDQGVTLKPPKPRDIFCSFEFPWLYSKICAIPQGADVLRMHTASGIFSDEAAFQDKAKESYEASKPTVDGGGRFSAASSPNGQNFFYDIVHKAEVSEDSEIPGLRAAKNIHANSISLWLHYSADPNKDEKWAEKIRDGMPDINSYMREYELDFSSLEGTRVFGTSFSTTKHILQNGEDEIQQHKPICVGFDWGFLHPAMLVTQFNEKDQWLWVREFLGEEMQTHVFLDVCAFLLGLHNFPRLAGLENISEEAQKYISERKLEPFISSEHKVLLESFCDIAGSQKSDKGEKTNIQIANSSPYFFRMRYKKDYIEPGITLLGLRLRTRKDGLPGLLVSQKCKLILEGFSGGFVRDKRGEVADTIYTHLFDCARYILINKSNLRKEQQPFVDPENKAEKFWSSLVKTCSNLPKPLSERQQQRMGVRTTYHTV